MSISLKELKKNRLTSTEKFVLETIDGCIPIRFSTGNVDWRKDGKWLFTQDLETCYLDVNYVIWSALRDDFGLKGDEIEELLNNLLYDYTDNGKLKII